MMEAGVLPPARPHELQLVTLETRVFSAWIWIQ